MVCWALFSWHSFATRPCKGTAAGRKLETEIVGVGFPVRPTDLRVHSPSCKREVGSQGAASFLRLVGALIFCASLLGDLVVSVAWKHGGILEIITVMATSEAMKRDAQVKDGQFEAQLVDPLRTAERTQDHLFQGMAAFWTALIRTSLLPLSHTSAGDPGSLLRVQSEPARAARHFCREVRLLEVSQQLATFSDSLQVLASAMFPAGTGRHRVSCGSAESQSALLLCHGFAGEEAKRSRPDLAREADSSHAKTISGP